MTPLAVAVTVRRRALLATLLALSALAAGCTLPGWGDGDAPPAAAEPVDVGPPPVEAGGFADCASSSALPLAMPLSARSTTDAEGHGPGIHRLDNATLLWVWAAYEDTLREDRVSRVNEVQALREPDGSYALCTRVELAAPTEADGEARTYDVAVLIEAKDGLPDAPLKVVVNWVAGCRCDPIPRGNTTARFDAATLVPESA